MRRTLFHTPCDVGVGHVPFAAEPDGLRIVEEELDECVLCDLCLEVAPGKIEIIKLYEQE